MSGGDIYTKGIDLASDFTLLDGNITASGNVSSSLTSTASFGILKLTADSHTGDFIDLKSTTRQYAFASAENIGSHPGIEIRRTDGSDVTIMTMTGENGTGALCIGGDNSGGAAGSAIPLEVHSDSVTNESPIIMAKSNIGLSLGYSTNDNDYTTGNTWISTGTHLQTDGSSQAISFRVGGRTSGSSKATITGDGNLIVSRSITAGTHITASGNASIAGTLEARMKSFVIPHPTQTGKKLVYGALEGPEHGVYTRGRVTGSIIELPEEWTGLVHEDSITVQLTPIGKHQNLYVEKTTNYKIFIKNSNLLNKKIDAFYLIQGTRKDIDLLTTIRES